MTDALGSLLETKEAERLATGFVFTEGPSGTRTASTTSSTCARACSTGSCPAAPRGGPREDGGGNGTTFDLQGRLVICEGDNRRVARMAADGRAVEVLVDRFEGKRLNRPNDVVCKSDGSIYFTDPGLRVPLAERELPYAGVYRVMPDGVISLVADFRVSERPRLLSRRAPSLRGQYPMGAVHPRAGPRRSGKMIRRRIFADMSSDETDGVPDGMKVDVDGRVYCTGPGGTWVFAPDGARLGIIRTPEVPANLAFGGPDLAHPLPHRAHVRVHAPGEGARAASSLFRGQR